MDAIQNRLFASADNSIIYSIVDLSLIFGVDIFPSFWLIDGHRETWSGRFFCSITKLVGCFLCSGFLTYACLATIITMSCMNGFEAVWNDGSALWSGYRSGFLTRVTTSKELPGWREYSYTLCIWNLSKKLQWNMNKELVLVDYTVQLTSAQIKEKNK